MAVADSIQNVGTDDIQNGAITNDKIADTTVSNGKLAGSIANDKLANSAITLNGDAVSLGGSATISGNTSRNLMINGAMEVSQKGGGSHTTAAQTYWIDRFYTYTAAAGRTISQSSNAPTGFRKSIKLQRDSGSSATNPQYLSQPAESASSVGFAGNKITLSFYARAGADFSPTSDYINVAVYSGTGTDQTLMTGLTGSVAVIGAVNQAITTSWVRYTFTSASAVPTDSNQLVFQILHSPTGTAGTNDWYEITGVQIEIGESATDFVHEDYGTTLAKCQRFFLNYVEGNTKSIGVGGFYNTTILACHIQPTVTFREAPSFAFGSGTGWYSADINGGTVTGNWTAVSWAQLNSVGFYGTFGTSTSGQVCFIKTNNTGAYIWFDAEM
jgi:hypothetical protein